MNSKLLSKSVSRSTTKIFGQFLKVLVLGIVASNLQAQLAGDKTGGVDAASAGTRSILPLLQRQIIGPTLSESEVQSFLENRIPRMPSVRTAAEWQHQAASLRQRVLDEVVFRGEQARQWREAKTKIEWLETIEGGPGYRIKKLRYEALPGLWIPALLYEPEKLSGKVPAILNVNG
jgi:hypothetical protein